MLDNNSFAFICELLEDQAGIAIEGDQDKFVACRLLPVAQKHGFDSLEPMMTQLRTGCDRRLIQEVIESLVTHETSFFRDAHYFDELTERILPRLIARQAPERRLSIWCAACSTGQEAYSVAMILREQFAQRLNDWHIELLATDLSEISLQQARSGRYTDVEVRRGLTPARLTQHFRQDGDGWQIDDRLKRMVRFQQLNLTAVWPPFPTMDLILLRNVLVYMNPATREKILTRMQRILHSEGRLILGSSESSGIPDARFATVRPGMK
ncbi:MAG: protein-glutamate O-methyltransferase CheR [Schlesneria sp.]